jgi:membrane fusion protein, heavy metal efflux system
MRRSMIAVAVGAALSVAGCTHPDPSPADAAPPPARVERESDNGEIRVAHPEAFPLATATRRDAAPEMNVTGVVAPDVSRSVPVVSMASGRVVDIRARLGDRVHKGQVLVRVQSADAAAAFSDYRKAVADEVLSRTQLTRSRTLYDRGAVARKDLEVAQDAEAKATVDVDTAREHLRVLGLDAARPPTGIVDVVAPVSGVITEQNVATAGGVKTLDNSPNLFTISDLSSVWIMCDVYENELPALHLGDRAEVRLNAYPDQAVTGRISNIGAALDPTTRTAKVRIEVRNPGFMRIGMFVTAIVRGQTTREATVVPATAILHLHDREWVYTPVDGSEFKRVEVVSGPTLPGNMQVLKSGLQAGQRVVSNALVFQNTVEQ